MSNILISSVNWLGDAVMSMPALQEYHITHPGNSITMLSKASVAPLWRMHPVVSDVIVLETGSTGSLRAASLVKQGAFERAYIFPNSMRSVLVPYLGGVPERIGFRGHQRAMLLTKVVDAAPPPGGSPHQAWEYVRILDLALAADAVLPAPRVGVTSRQLEEAAALIGCSADAGVLLLALMPGAARGSSKRWPPEHFAEAGRRLRKRTGAKLVVLGAYADHDECQSVSDSIGEGVINLCGKTSLEQLAGVLAMCGAVICNDSGGMHLASAVGSRVVAVFGMTDPARTGPLGEGHRVIMRPGVQGSRDIPRESQSASDCLRSIPPEDVVHAAELVLSGC